MCGFEKPIRSDHFKVQRILSLSMAVGLCSVAAASEFRISAVGGNNCGFWGASCGACCGFGPGLAACGSAPVADSGSFTDGIHPATYRYSASAGCDRLVVHTEIDWFCNCGSLCAENNGTARMLLDDVVFTGPPGATLAYFRMTFKLAVPTLINGTWRFQATAPSGSLLDTGDQSGKLPPTQFVSSLRIAGVNMPQTFLFTLSTGIHAVDQVPNPRAEAQFEFPCGLPAFAFFDDFGQPVTGFSVQSPTCPLGSICGIHDGDMNADGRTDGRDVQAFTTDVVAGSSAPAELCHGDFSNDCLMDSPDVPGFVAALLTL